MNLAEATAALSKKENEKSQVAEEIRKLEELRSEGITAILRGAVFGMTSVPEDRAPTFTYRHFANEAGGHTAEHVDQAINEGVRIHLSEVVGELSITCTLRHTADSAETAQADLLYVAQIPINDIPDNTEMRTELSAFPASNQGEGEGIPASIVLNLKASLDHVASMIERKVVELEQVQQEFDEAVAKVQEVKKKPTAKTSSGKTKATKKGSAKSGRKSPPPSSAGSRGRETHAGEEDEAEPAPQASMFDGLTEKAMSAAEYVLEKRAFVLFPVVAVIIHLYGDYASV